MANYFGNKLDLDGLDPNRKCVVCWTEFYRRYRVHVAICSPRCRKIATDEQLKNHRYLVKVALAAERRYLDARPWREF
jgi:predicted nucleic acid-binding Zn ribbon protein